MKAIKLYMVLILLIQSFAAIGLSPAAAFDVFTIEADGSCQLDKESSAKIGKAVAHFKAKRKAIGVAGRYFSNKGLIPPYNDQKDEIYNLAAREVETEILDQHQDLSNIHIRLRVNIQPTDFIKAEMAAIRLGKKDLRSSFKEKMEQPISQKIDPGLDIAKAYNLLRQKKWRIAIIYLDHLEQKYPNWESIYMAKATSYYILNESVFMKVALSKACELGNTTACEDLKNIKQLNDHDFGISTPELR